MKFSLNNYTMKVCDINFMYSSKANDILYRVRNR